MLKQDLNEALGASRINGVFTEGFCRFLRETTAVSREFAAV